MTFAPSILATRARPLPFVSSVAPGLLLCAGLAAAARGLEAAERAVFGRAWFESLAIAILLGAALRAVWAPGPRFAAGIDLCARRLIEAAVVLLGLSVSASALLAGGWALPAAIALVVAVAILGGYGVGRLLGLNRRLATLIACGNAICGNTAIAAVAPVIGAKADEVAPAIAFTAALGIAAVLGLPLLGAALHQTPLQFGALAGLTVYAVPQVLAAAAPAGPAAVQFGAAVKLTRVLMLGPVFAVLSLTGASEDRPRAPLSPLTLVPWFVLGFAACAALRAAGLVPAAVVAPAAQLTNLLTLLSMAALGLTADLAALRRAGPRAAGAAVLSLGLLLTLALVVIKGTGL